MRYTNPVIPGFYPDPSVCRVGDDYYVVTSSFEYFPGVPIFHSRDLVHWRQIGHCLTRDTQLPLQGVGSSAGVYAPTIRHHDGRFYMVTTIVGGLGNVYVYADDPAGPWSEPIKVDQGGIDPSLFFDADGTVYFTSESGNGVQQSTIDIATGERTSEVRILWTGTGGRYPEAPHLYHIGDYYYLMLAEGGTEYGHMETIARSDSPWGPFEACPYNPILTHRDAGSHAIQATGHADLVQLPDGSWWAVFLAIRPLPGYPPVHHLGRETFLAPVTWTEDGWPIFGKDGVVDVEAEGPSLAPAPWPAPAVRDEFAGDALASCWNFRGNPIPDSWALTPAGLELRGTATTLDKATGLTWIGRRQTDVACRAATQLDFAPQAGHSDEAGLTVLITEAHHYEIFVRRGATSNEIAVRRRIGDLVAVVAAEPTTATTVELHVEASVERYKFGYREGDGDVRWIAEGSPRFLSTEVAGGFTGVLFGLYATGNGAPASSPATFAWFDYAAITP